MAKSHTLGLPRIGPRRELKFALEKYWSGEAGGEALDAAGRELRRDRWRSQAALDFVTAGDFSFYDHVLDCAVDLGVVAARDFDAYFALARGSAKGPAMEMTKWFDTNYHYLVPQLGAAQGFRPDPSRIVAEVREARAPGKPVKPVLLGPLTFLWLSKSPAGDGRLSLLPALVDAYRELLLALAQEGVEWVQVDEPALVMGLDRAWIDACESALGRLAGRIPKLLLTTYFESLETPPERVARWPFDGIHLDLVRAPQQLTRWRAALPKAWVLSAGVIDGRNIWRTDLERTLDLLEPVHDELGDRLWIAPSCSLLHVPVSLDGETDLDPEVRGWLAFAREKLEETAALATALDQGRGAVAEALRRSREAVASRRSSARIRNEAVARRIGSNVDARSAPFESRRAIQARALALPLLPTTTIGSFPQTSDIRSVRSAFKRGEIGAAEYRDRMREEIRQAVEKQEALGLDVLVHGEPERNDMVEFFGERLSGYAFTDNGWVQSYGSRCVKPPILYGDVSREEPMTVELTRYAQSLTKKPMKGMLTGPVTLMKWSFVRDDQPLELTTRQLAWCIRDEVDDLQKAGIRVIQIDEPALREALPLKRPDWPGYLDWAVECFRIASSVAADETQVHTHMCYAEFNDILPAIAAMDADVVTIETSRSNMELLDAFGSYAYPNDVGPGVYDIHSPRIPTVAEMTRLLERASAVIPLDRLWVNPDCGLKTRAWSETQAALANMVQAAQSLRMK